MRDDRRQTMTAKLRQRSGFCSPTKRPTKRVRSVLYIKDRVEMRGVRRQAMKAKLRQRTVFTRRLPRTATDVVIKMDTSPVPVAEREMEELADRLAKMHVSPGDERMDTSS